jgi:predicted phage terminase large subunit-like protein
VDVLCSPARNKLVVCGRRWGKTVAGLIAVVEGHGPRPGGFRGALDGAVVWWVAPSYPMATEIWRDLKRSLHEAWTDKSESERRIVLPSGGSVAVRSADNPDSLRGVGLDGLVIDEAAFVPEEAWTEALRPTLSDRQGWALFISTPNGQNWFQRLFENAASAPGWARWQRPTADNPKIPPEEFEAARRDLGAYAFAREYEASFATAGGGLFKREWLRYHVEAPTGCYSLADHAPGIPLAALRRFATVDLACSTRETADYTVIASWGATPEGRLLLLDLERARLEGPDIIPAIRRHVERWKLGFVAIERTGFQLALLQQARRDGLPVRELVADRDKLARALPATAAMEAGRVWFPRAAPWLADVEAELLAFPTGAHDDVVDALAYAVHVARTLLGFTDVERMVPVVTTRVADAEDDLDDERGDRVSRLFAGFGPDRRMSWR